MLYEAMTHRCKKRGAFDIVTPPLKTCTWNDAHESERSVFERECVCGLWIRKRVQHGRTMMKVSYWSHPLDTVHNTRTQVNYKEWFWSIHVDRWYLYWL